MRKVMKERESVIDCHEGLPWISGKTMLITSSISVKTRWVL